MKSNEKERKKDKERERKTEKQTDTDSQTNRFLHLLTFQRDSSLTTLTATVDGQVAGQVKKETDVVGDLLFNPVISFGGFNYDQEQFKK